MLSKISFCQHCKLGEDTIQTLKQLYIYVIKTKTNKPLKELHDEKFEDLLTFTSHLSRDFIAEVRRGNHTNTVDSRANIQSFPCKICDFQKKMINDLTNLVNHLSKPLEKKTIESFRLKCSWDSNLSVQKSYFIKLVQEIDENLSKWKSHLWLTGNQYKKFEENIEKLKEGEELWLFDYQMTQRLGLSKRETQQQFMSHEKINNLGLLKIQKINSKLIKHYYHFMSQDLHHDTLYTCCCLEYLLKHSDNVAISNLKVLIFILG